MDAGGDGNFDGYLYVDSAIIAPTLRYSNGNMNIKTTSDNPIIFSINNTERLRIRKGTGYVGIGTTDPSEKLEVDGIIKTTGLKGTVINDFSFNDLNGADTIPGTATDKSPTDNQLGGVFYMGNNSDGVSFICRSNGNSSGEVEVMAIWQLFQKDFLLRTKSF